MAIIVGLCVFVCAREHVKFSLYKLLIVKAIIEKITQVYKATKFLTVL